MVCLHYMMKLFSLHMLTSLDVSDDLLRIAKQRNYYVVKKWMAFIWI